MNIKSAEYLFYFCFKVPCTQFIHLYDGFSQRFSIVRSTYGFIVFYSMNDRMVLLKNIFQNRLALIQCYILLKQNNPNIFMYPYIAFVRGFFPSQNMEECGLPASIFGY